MMGDRLLLKNFIEKFLGTVRFGNDHFAAITSYGDYVQGDRESNLYTISISDMAASSPVYLMSKDTSTKESMNIPSKEDLDNLFWPMYEEYFEKKSSEMSINSAAQQVYNHEESHLTSLIIVEEHEAPPIITTYKE
ncbi:hypothetical protein Tco_0918777 [Tanacetum coccineum]